MQIALSGAGGFIGTALTEVLRADGHTVVPLVRRPVTDGEPAISWDPEGGTIDAPALEGLDAVVHLAGEPIAAKRWTDEQKRRILDSRVQGTTLLADTLAKLDAPPPVLLSGSAIGVYGERGDEVLTEQSPAGDGFLAEVVQAWESSTASAEAAGIRVAHLRTGIVLGPGGGALGKLLAFARFGLAGRLGSGKQWWSWISLADELRAIVHLLDADVAGPVNLTAPHPVTNAEFTKEFGTVMHRPTFLPVPKFGPALLLGRELAEELLFTSARVLPTTLEASGFAFSHPDLGTALRAELDR